MPTVFDQQIDAIFGEPAQEQACADALRVLAAALKPVGPQRLWLIDAENRVLADWWASAELADEPIPEAFAQPGDDAILRPSEAGAELLMNVLIRCRGVDRGRLVGRLRALPSEGVPEAFLARRFELLRTVGGLLLELRWFSEVLAENEARLRQLTRQHGTFQEEHRRIVAMNLLERDARLAEQRTYTARLREEVQERTRQLLERTADLEESEARNRAIVDTAPDGIITIDADGNIGAFNAAAARMFGYAAEEVLGRNVRMLVPDADGETQDPRLSRFLRSSPLVLTGNERHLKGQRKDGSEFPIALAVSDVCDGPQQTVTAIVRDITEQQQAEKSLREYARALEEGTEALEEATLQAEAASRSKSEFLANMSHEIRTPMTAIMGHADLLREQDQTEPERMASAEAIYRNAAHLLQLMNDILDLSKIEAGKLNIEEVACSPGQVIAEVASMMRVRAHEKNLYFYVDYPGLVPATIRSDPTRLRQILVNLVGNAIKFTQTGGIRIACSLVDPPDASEARLRFDVVDSGIGIAADRLERIFEPFVQADSSTTRVFGGTGLGLAISRRLARALGGDIRVESQPDRGSTFTLTIETGSLLGTELLNRPNEAEWELGAERKPLSACHAHASVGMPPTAHVSLSGRRILLAEDGLDNQHLISHHLKKAGAEVVIAENGRVALEKALASPQPFDLVFMDMQMPVMDGYTATAELRKRGYTHPVVALTAHAMVGDREKCLEAGCDDYMTKPIDRHSLLELAARYAGRGTPSVHSPDDAEPNEVTDAGAEPITSQFAGDPAMGEIIERFLARLPETLEAVAAAVQANDRKHLRQVCHQLKGAAGGYGFPIITEKAAAVEQLAHSGADEIALQAASRELSSICRRALATSNSRDPRALCGG
jgi:PAS domain S-box-containing protein